MKNPVVHFEIRSQDPAALREFYSSLSTDIDVGVNDYGLVTEVGHVRPVRRPAGAMHGHRCQPDP